MFPLTMVEESTDMWDYCARMQIMLGSAKEVHHLYDHFCPATIHLPPQLMKALADALRKKTELNQHNQ